MAWSTSTTEKTSSSSSSSALQHPVKLTTTIAREGWSKSRFSHHPNHQRGNKLIIICHFVAHQLTLSWSAKNNNIKLAQQLPPSRPTPSKSSNTSCGPNSSKTPPACSPSPPPPPHRPTSSSRTTIRTHISSSSTSNTRAVDRRCYGWRRLEQLGGKVARLARRTTGREAAVACGVLRAAARLSNFESETTPGDEKDSICLVYDSKIHTHWLVKNIKTFIFRVLKFEYRKK